MNLNLIKKLVAGKVPKRKEIQGGCYCFKDGKEAYDFILKSLPLKR